MVHLSGISVLVANATLYTHHRDSSALFFLWLGAGQPRAPARPSKQRQAKIASSAAPRIASLGWALTHAPLRANCTFATRGSFRPKASDSTIMLTRPLKSTSGFQFKERRARLESPRRSRISPVRKSLGSTSTRSEEHTSEL